MRNDVCIAQIPMSWYKSYEVPFLVEMAMCHEFELCRWKKSENFVNMYESRVVLHKFVAIIKAVKN